MPSNASSPAERSLRARIAAHALHAQGGTNTVPARNAFLERFARQVDPDGTLTPTERSKRAEHALRAHMLTLAIKSAKARRRTAPDDDEA